MLQEQIIKNFNIYNYKDYFTKTFLWQKVFCSNFAESFLRRLAIYNERGK